MSNTNTRRSLAEARRPDSRLFGRYATVVAVLLMLPGCTQDPPIPEGDRFSESELSALVDTDLSQMEANLTSRYPELVIPDVELVRYISPEEANDLTASCMSDEGFEAQRDSNGGTSYNGITAEQLGPFEVAQYVCASKYPIDPKYRIPLNDKQLGYLYDYYTGDLTRCLGERDVTVSNPPSRGAFVANYYDQGGVWTPYEGVRAGNQEDWARLNKECPQMPDGLTPK